MSRPIAEIKEEFAAMSAVAFGGAPRWDAVPIWWSQGSLSQICEGIRLEDREYATAGTGLP